MIRLAEGGSVPAASCFVEGHIGVGVEVCVQLDCSAYGA
jgi:hypothetical protein